MKMLSLTTAVKALSANGMTLGERIVYAGQMTLLGMLVIFAVLAILWGAIALMNRIMQGRGEKTEEEKAPSTPAASKQEPAVIAAPVPAPASVSASTPAPAPAPAVSEDSAVLAAITAAIAVVWEVEHPGTGFRVVSYRHIDKRSAWNTK